MNGLSATAWRRHWPERLAANIYERTNAHWPYWLALFLALVVRP